ncbi:MAG: hydrolase Nlp/P60 [Flavobacteriales bacterium]|nr:MAG: hydrolase Nlp/P60 [Flavobacteriales bacterium]
MEYGVCMLSNIALRGSAKHESTMASQLLFGDVFKVIETNKDWAYIQLDYDQSKGWIPANQVEALDKTAYQKITGTACGISNEYIDFIEDKNHKLLPVVIGSVFPGIIDNSFYINSNTYQFSGAYFSTKQPKQTIVHTAFKYLNSPYLYGGKTPFGIDSSGLVQMAYKISGYKLPRYVGQQVQKGEALSFIEESEPGDLAFFDNSEGEIIHVGILLKDNYIIHVDDKVRIDRLDQSGLFNTSVNRHTHNLRVIKKII